MMHPNALLLSAAIAVTGLVLLIVRFKVSAFIALTITSIFLGLCAGLAPAVIFKSFQDGLGSVLASISLVIALGTVLGRILGETRGAEAIALWLLKSFGPKRMVLAFFFIGLVVGLPVFFAVGLVLAAPVLFATAQQKGIPLLRLGLPMVAGLSAAHGLVPPHPGPLAAIDLLHANIGKTLLYSLPVALVAGGVAGPLLLRWLPAGLLQKSRPSSLNFVTSESPLPRVTPVLAVILLPIALIAAGSVAEVALPASNPLRPALLLFGHPISALLVGIAFAVAALG
ncbi:MAG TPA: permease DsdX, partial [Verrucomicrobiae bacterium]|nr:permease DsdX [Verrucomicrobiae bacterium]